MKPPQESGTGQPLNWCIPAVIKESVFKLTAPVGLKGQELQYFGGGKLE